ncbi:LysR family transcriptional regulator [Bordetella genomosp. 5]|uniref:LysR family transcriptional regulator n=1 Tax=Bordetella genomosp. 5 TaxID=1395608 RepID=A0A261TZU1_9BORD|nr:LysR family transcriptional regulator [Bordetella genomosp. 5]OZI55206.1 LysR family transcriptional regulator [Bordetella genomosp. 5]
MDHLLSIRIFHRIVETGSFTQASSHLGLPRSTVSKGLLALEAHLGAKLLQRTTRRVSLTVEGAEYYRRTQQVTAHLEEADEALRIMGSAAQGRVRIDVYSSFAHHVLIPALGYFKAECPDVQVAMGINDRPVDLIEEGVDCVIRSGALPDSAMVAKTLFVDQLVTCASPAYLERFGVPQSPDELFATHKLVGYFGSATSEIWPLTLSQKNIVHQATRFDMLSNDSAGQIAMLVGGQGVGQTHRLVVDKLIEAGALTPILEHWGGLTTPISVMYPSSKRVSRRTKLFVEWLTRYLKHYAVATGSARGRPKKTGQ